MLKTPGQRAALLGLLAKKMDAKIILILLLGTFQVAFCKCGRLGAKQSIEGENNGKSNVVVQSVVLGKKKCRSAQESDDSVSAWKYGRFDDEDSEESREREANYMKMFMAMMKKKAKAKKKMSQQRQIPSHYWKAEFDDDEPRQSRRRRPTKKRSSRRRNDDYDEEDYPKDVLYLGPKKSLYEYSDEMK